MREVNALIFPDNCIQRREYISACRLFFDKLLCPPAAPIPDRSLFEGAEQAATSSGLPFDRGIFEKTTVLVNSQYDLIQLKLAAPIQPINNDNELMYAHRIQTLSILTHENQAFRTTLANAAKEENVWLEHPPSSHRDTDLHTALEYGFKALTRIRWAKENSVNIATGSLRQHNAVKLIQATAFADSHAGKPYPVVTEFMRFTIPHLVAKSYEDLLEVEHKLFDHVEPFKIEMRRLHSQLPESTNLCELMNHIRCIVDRDVNPKIMDLRRYLETEKPRLAKSLIGPPSVAATTTATLVACLTAFVNPAEFLNIFKIAFGITLPITHSINKLIDARLEKIHVQYENPLTFAVLTDPTLNNN